MSENIKPGDLVMVVKLEPCCGNPYGLGSVFSVSHLRRVIHAKCAACGMESNDVAVAEDAGGGGFCLLSRLKKIDPPTEGDSLPTRRKLDNPA